jgi:hypothetical protein
LANAIPRDKMNNHNNKNKEESDSEEKENIFKNYGKEQNILK